VPYYPYGHQATKMQKPDLVRSLRHSLEERGHFMTESRLRCLRLALPVFASLLASGFWTTRAVVGQQRPADPAVRLYVFDCGVLLSQNIATYNLEETAAPNGDMSVPCFLVSHSRGTLIWDTGGVPDSRVTPGISTDLDLELVPGRGIPWRVDRRLKDQLAEIGYKPTDITYIALSHMHYDHTANANDYAASMWLVQEVERDRMFGQPPPTNFSTYSELKSSKTILLHGDHDVFGDGAVIVKSSPGHTVGHQSLFVKLAKAGSVLLSGDLYHYPEERALGVVPTFEFNKEQSQASRAAMEQFMKERGAQLWIQHDIVSNVKLKKSPLFYE
jgi:N-acyl homoserine lactone hydrolase